MRFIYAIPLLLISACTVHHRPLISTTSIAGRNEKPIRVTSAESQAVYVLGIGPFGDDSIEAAIENAKEGTTGDSLVNVFVDKKITYFPFPWFSLFFVSRTSIYGTLVSYVDSEGKDILRKKTKFERIQEKKEDKRLQEQKNLEKINRNIQVLKSLDKEEMVEIILRNGTSKKGCFSHFEAGDAYFWSNDKVRVVDMRINIVEIEAIKAIEK